MIYTKLVIDNDNHSVENLKKTLKFDGGALANFLWQENPDKLPDNCTLAKSCTKNLVNKLRKYPKLFKRIQEFYRRIYWRWYFRRSNACDWNRSSSLPSSSNCNK